MKIKYVGELNDGLPEKHVSSAFGFDFVRGQEVEVPDSHPAAWDIVQRVEGNHHFEFVGPKPKLSPPQGPVAMSPQPIADPATYTAKA